MTFLGISSDNRLHRIPLRRALGLRLRDFMRPPESLRNVNDGARSRKQNASQPFVFKDFFIGPSIFTRIFTQEKVLSHLVVCFLDACCIAATAFTIYG